jgi:hypothetical protein
LAAPAAAQKAGNLAEPQYQLSGKDYSKEAPAIQKMLYNIAGAVQKQISFNSTIPSTVSGAVSAATVTVNFPLSGTGAPANPISLTGAIPPVNVSLATVTTALATKAGNGANGDITSFTALTSPFESGVRQPTVNIDLSSVTTALAGKLSSTLAIPPVLVDLSTVTTALANKIDKAAIPPVYVDLSTVTTALAGKQASFVGITSSCAAGFYMSSGTWANGVETGGGCVGVSNGVNGSPGASPGWVVDDFSYISFGSTMSFNLSQAPAASSAVFVYRDGLKMALWTDYQIQSGSPWVVTMTLTPTNKTTSFQIGYTVNTTTVSAVGVLNATQTWTGSNYFTNLFPTRQVLTSGTGATYTTPSGAYQLKIRMVGGGGGGGDAVTNTGSPGGATSFYQVVASSGLGGGHYSTDIGGVGGSAGTNGGVTGVFRVNGYQGLTTAGHMSGMGGSSYMGAGASAFATGGNTGGNSAGSNTGGGGGGGCSSSSQCGGGGGGGEYAEFILNGPLSTSYSYTIGAGGNGGGTSPVGGAGGSGVIIVDEYYR